ncbi:MAG: hypothetical protein AB7J32_07635 [Pseudonocardia sp.]
MTFLSAPVAGLGQEGEQQSVVYLDDVRAGELWEALRTGSAGRHAVENRAATLGEASS